MESSQGEAVNRWNIQSLSTEIVNEQRNEKNWKADTYASMNIYRCQLWGRFELPESLNVVVPVGIFQNPEDKDDDLWWKL